MYQAFISGMQTRQLLGILADLSQLCMPRRAVQHLLTGFQVLAQLHHLTFFFPPIKSPIYLLNCTHSWHHHQQQASQHFTICPNEELLLSSPGQIKSGSLFYIPVKASFPLASYPFYPCPGMDAEREREEERCAAVQVHPLSATATAVTS